ncbi:MAG: zinc-dependent metalloprotease [Phaeodactylibacter sp.]|nr:zinc-dependent metalloprotease [Phaeodactylibacter sp.]
MKRPLLSFIFLLGVSQLLHAQISKSDLQPCGSPPGKSAWLKRYQQNPQAYTRSMDTTLYVPLTIHLLAQDNGNGYFSQSQLLDALCRLNSDFGEANIQFFVEGEVNYLPNSGWNNHEDVLAGADMMFANNVPNTINTYFANDPAGNCGYNLPYAGIAMAKACSGPNDHTWAHEVGHNLSVQHPFLGWEGGVSHDGSISHNFSNPAPLTVTYDYTYFKDTLIRDTLIIDTALVEFVDGSNCHIAADGFCDTRPDYIASRWNCNINGESPQEQTDPAGAKFRSDGSLIMGYSDDACQARFTPEQIAAMRANLYEEKAGYLYNQTPLPPVSAEPTTLLAPGQDELVQYDAVFLEWEPLENATHYLVQVSRLASLPATGALTSNYIVTTTSLALPEVLQIDRDYYWRVRGYNSHSFCSPVTAAGRFRAAQVMSANSLDAVSNLRLSPNPVVGGQPILLEFDAAEAFSASLDLFAATGQVIRSQKLAVQAGNNRFSLATDELAPGLYFARMECETGRTTGRVVIR